jgi:hypothetical protein
MSVDKDRDNLTALANTKPLNPDQIVAFFTFHYVRSRLGPAFLE